VNVHISCQARNTISGFQGPANSKMRRYIRSKPTGGHLRSPGSISPVRTGVCQSCAKVVQMSFVPTTETPDSRVIGNRPTTGSLGQFGSSARVVGRRRWTPQPCRRRLVKARQRIAHPLSRRTIRDANDVPQNRLRWRKSKGLHRSPKCGPGRPGRNHRDAPQTQSGCRERTKSAQTARTKQNRKG